jgi:2-polyprenyl-3-methyl-5-hydroxy-6-metoxy-1,4-benzoquinol methylase
MYDKELEQYYIDLYKQVHTEPQYNPKNKIYGYGDGKTVYDRWKELRYTFDKWEVYSILDFGAGKAAHHNNLNMYQKRFGITDVDLYEPAIEEYAELKDRTYDAVVCADVMEHIPEVNVEHTIQQINSRADKVAFYIVSGNESQTILPNGENAHITRKPKSWWSERILKHAKGDCQYYLMITFGKRESFYHLNSGARLEAN